MAAFDQLLPVTFAEGSLVTEISSTIIFVHFFENEPCRQVPQELFEKGDVWMSEVPGFVAATINNNVLTLDFWDVNKSPRLHTYKKHAFS